MFCQNPYLGLLALLSGLLYLIVKNGAKAIKNSSWMLLVPFAGAIINPLFNHNGETVIFVLNDNPISMEALLYGLSSGLMIAAVLLWFTSFTQIMTSDKLLYVFGSISPKLALILSMTLRYIPLFKKQITKTSNAQKVMGLYKEDNAIDKVKGGMRIFSIMVSWALENGVITADSMTARGYGTGPRSRFAIFKWTKSDVMLLITSLLLTSFCCYGTFSGRLSYSWYPGIIKPENSAINTICYFAFIILTLIPDFLQIKEELRWKSLQSKI